MWDPAIHPAKAAQIAASEREAGQTGPSPIGALFYGIFVSLQFAAIYLLPWIAIGWLTCRIAGRTNDLAGIAIIASLTCAGYWGIRRVIAAPAETPSEGTWEEES